MATWAESREGRLGQTLRAIVIHVLARQAMADLLRDLGGPHAVRGVSTAAAACRSARGRAPRYQFLAYREMGVLSTVIVTCASTIVTKGHLRRGKVVRPSYMGHEHGRSGTARDREGAAGRDLFGPTLALRSVAAPADIGVGVGSGGGAGAGASSGTEVSSGALRGAGWASAATEAGESGVGAGIDAASDTAGSDGSGALRGAGWASAAGEPPAGAAATQVMLAGCRSIVKIRRGGKP